MKRCIVLVCLAALGATRTAAADDKATCLEAASEGQTLRDAHKLFEARAKFRVCAAAGCPAVVQSDCAHWLDEADKAQPTVVFIAKDASGKDVSAVRVTVDGKPLTETLDGTGLAVDPGRHVFTFTVAGQAPVATTLVLASGEKDRREHISLGGAAAGADTATAQSASVHGGHLVVTADQAAAISIDGNVAGTGRFDGHPTPGPHEILVTQAGMRPYKAEIDLRDGETRTLQVTLEREHHATLWPWIVGGAALAAGAAVGSYFLFKPSDTVTPVPPGNVPTAKFMSWRP
jgi:hypothetical protein